MKKSTDIQTPAPRFGAGFFAPPPSNSADLRRILAVPRRALFPLDGPRGQALVELMTSRLAIENNACNCEKGACLKALRPIQAWALYEAPLARGMLAPIGVGHGKTLLDILMPMVFPKIKTAVLLIPPGLKNQLLRDYEAASQHFRVPSLVVQGGGKIFPGRPVLHVVPYSRFSMASATSLLSELQPDLIIADEAHKLRYKQTSTTSRVLRYLSSNLNCILCAWSGTLTSRSIKDYAHLSIFALGDAAPLPEDAGELEAWSLVLDPSENPNNPGALSQLMKKEDSSIQQAFYRRLSETVGIVTTKESSIAATQYLSERKAPNVPGIVREAIDKLNKTWTREDGEELTEALEVSAVARQISCGFYYRWKFPHGEPEALIKEWFEARKKWNRELREKLKTRREGLDSAFLCREAANRFINGYKGPKPVWDCAAYPAWLELENQVKPETEAVWLSDYLAEDAARWAASHKGIVWYEHSTFGAKVAKISGLTQHGGGEGAEAKILAENGDKSLIVSIKAHGTGRDGLQRIFAKQLVTSPPSSGATWEQLLGRLHRIGQKEDEIFTEIYRHTDSMREALDKAFLGAKYIQETLGTQQKLLQVVREF